MVGDSWGKVRGSRDWSARTDGGFKWYRHVSGAQLKPTTNPAQEYFERRGIHFTDKEAWVWVLSFRGWETSAYRQGHDRPPFTWANKMLAIEFWRRYGGKPRRVYICKTNDAINGVRE